LSAKLLTINSGSSSLRFALFGDGRTHARLDRFHLVADVIDRVPTLGLRAAYAKQALRDKLIEHKQYIAEHGEDMPEIRNWKWDNLK
jgi:phosphoketolase